MAFTIAPFNNLDIPNGETVALLATSSPSLDT